ncbi:MAG: membrane lipoprotein lipid attachment site-containing protein [Paludibacteraceae bacterium]|nr:membrane lipoprotein lipid attachment site-containing protein [Paludibacteraceae bacterium]
MKKIIFIILTLVALLSACNGNSTDDGGSHFSGCDPNLNDLHYPQKSLKRNAPAELPDGIDFDAEFLIATATDSSRIKLVYYNSFPCGGYNFHSNCELKGNTINFGAWTTKGHGIPMPCICSKTVTYVVEGMKDGEDYTIYLQNRCYLSFKYTSGTDTIFVIQPSNYSEYSGDEPDYE